MYTYFIYNYLINKMINLTFIVVNTVDYMMGIFHRERQLENQKFHGTQPSENSVITTFSGEEILFHKLL